ncbi:MAG: hypothetical protein GC164_05010 [Phycisphaera sp.]|nr:hypothetical protein [Phycisphaera sp.]
MSQPHTPSREQDLPGLPRGPLSPAQQLDALKRVKDQAEQRVKVGMQLFRAAEAHTTQYQHAINEIKVEQQALREEIQRDMTQTLRSYDQWVHQIEGRVNDRVQQLDERLEQVEQRWAEMEERIMLLVRRAETLFDQSRIMLSGFQPMWKRAAAVGANIKPTTQQPVRAEPGPTDAATAPPQPQADLAQWVADKATSSPQTPQESPAYDADKRTEMFYENLVRKLRPTGFDDDDEGDSTPQVTDEAA